MNKQIKSTFFDLFWKHKAIQNLFLLSKEEFLDTKLFSYSEKPIPVTFPRIILSNITSKEDYNLSKIKLRTQKHVNQSEALIKSVISSYEPLIAAFIETKYGASFEQLIKDFSANPLEILLPIVMSLFSDEGPEKAVIEFLHRYNFVGRHIQSFEQLEHYIEREAFQKTLKIIFSEKNLWTLLELVKSFKDLYISEVYKGLHNSNQVLVSSFHDIDNFAGRLKLFSMLYDAEIITSSKEDSFIECTECHPDSYRGVISFKINPIRLKKMKCPICNSPVTYYVPYELNSHIYSLVKQKDGILLAAVEDLLKRNQLKFKLNEHHLDDIEIDCVYKIQKQIHVVECKMYKQNVPLPRLESKIKQHYTKLVRNIIRIQEDKGTNPDLLTPVLVVNINDKKFLETILKEMKKENTNKIFLRGVIVGINDLPLK
jgi:hypothetical protein